MRVKHLKITTHQKSQFRGYFTIVMLVLSFFCCYFVAQKSSATKNNKL